MRAAHAMAPSREGTSSTVKPPSNSTRPNGKRKQPTMVIPVVSITKANYTRLFKDKFLKRSDVCSGAYKKYCK